jgi:ABC-2 type transport system permease protein
MTRLLRAEWRKLTTTRIWWTMLLGAIAFSTINVVAQIATNGSARSQQLPLSNPATQRAIFSAGSSGYLFTLIVGVIVVASEFRHFTSRPTFLVEPRRERVIASKLGVMAFVGFLYALACIAVSSMVALIWLGAKGIDIQWSAGSLPLVLIGDVGVVAIYSVVGVGVGVLVRNQVAAIVGALMFTLFIEPIAAVVPGVKDAFRFFPTGAARAITGAGGASTSTDQAPLLSGWQGALLLVGWGLVFAACGWVITLRRDIP